MWQQILLTAVLLTWVSESSAAPPIAALAIAPDGKSVVAGSQAGLRVYTWPRLKPSQKLETKLSHVHDLAFSPDGTALAVVGGAPAELGSLEVFSWPEGKLRFRVHPHEDLIYGVAWHPDGKTLATAGYDRTVGIHDAKTGRRVRTLKGHSRGVLAVCYAPDGKTLISAGRDQSLRVWDVASGKQLRSLDNHTRAVHDLATRPGQPKDALPVVVSVSDDRTVRLWQPTIGRLMRFARLDAVPVAVAWAADGTKIAVACTDGRLRVIDPDTVEITTSDEALDGRAHCLAVSQKKADAALVGGVDGQLKFIPIKAGR